MDMILEMRNHRLILNIFEVVYIDSKIFKTFWLFISDDSLTLKILVYEFYDEDIKN